MRIIITIGENLIARRKEVSVWKAGAIGQPYVPSETKESSFFEYDTENKIYYDDSLFEESKVLKRLFSNF